MQYTCYMPTFKCYKLHKANEASSSTKCRHIRTKIVLDSKLLKLKVTWLIIKTRKLASDSSLCTTLRSLQIRPTVLGLRLGVGLGMTLTFNPSKRSRSKVSQFKRYSGNKWTEAIALPPMLTRSVITHIVTAVPKYDKFLPCTFCSQFKLTQKWCIHFKNTLSSCLRQRLFNFYI